MSLIIASAGFTRPADAVAYAAGDIVANSLTANAVVPLSFYFGGDVNPTPWLIRQARLVRSSAVTTMAFRLWLFRGQPYAAGGYPADNAALAFSRAAALQCIGSLNFLTTDFAAQNACAVAVNNIAAPFVVYPDAPVFGLLEARTAVALGNAEQFDVALTASRL